MSRLVKSKPTPSRFSTLPALTGFEVIDADGRALASELSEGEAQEAANTLNSIARNGPRAVSNALSKLTREGLIA